MHIVSTFTARRTTKVAIGADRSREFGRLWGVKHPKGAAGTVREVEICAVEDVRGLHDWIMANAGATATFKGQVFVPMRDLIQLRGILENQIQAWHTLKVAPGRRAEVAKAVETCIDACAKGFQVFCRGIVDA